MHLNLYRVKKETKHTHTNHEKQNNKSTCVRIINLLSEFTHIDRVNNKNVSINKRQQNQKLSATNIITGSIKI